MLQLVKLEEKYRTQLSDMMEEWTATSEKIVPYAICKNDYRDFQYYLANLECKEETKNWVPDSVFFTLSWRCSANF